MKIIVITVPKSGTYLWPSFIERWGFINTHWHVGPRGTGYFEPKDNYPNSILNVVGKNHSKNLVDIISSMPNNGIIQGHITFSNKHEKILTKHKCFFFYRNLRDRLISAIRFDIKREWKNSSPTINDVKKYLFTPTKNMHGTKFRSQPKYSKLTANLVKWIDVERVCKIKYEDVINPNTRLKELQKIIEHLQLECSDESILRVYDSITKQNFGTRMSHHTNWQDWWDTELEKWFVTHMKQYNTLLGYE